MEDRFELPKIQPDLIGRQNILNLYDKALQQYKVCYISGIAGCGKTHSLIHWILQGNLFEKYQIIYMDLKQVTKKLEYLKSGFNHVHKGKKAIIIIDQFQLLEFHKRMDLISWIKEYKETAHIFLLSRSIMPILFVENFYSSELMVVNTDQFFLSRHEVIEYLKKKNLIEKRHFEAELSTEVWWLPIMLEVIACYQVDIFRLTKQIEQELKMNLLDYMNRELFEHCEEELKKVMIETAMLPYVTYDLIELLSDQANIIEQVESFSKQTCYIQCSKKGDIYQNKTFLHYTKCMFEYYVSDQRKEEIFRIAANYYNIIHDFKNSVDCYMKIKEYDSIMKLCYDYLWDKEKTVSYKELFFICCKLPKNEIIKYRELYFLLAIGYGFMYQFEYAKDCYEELKKEMELHYTGSEQDEQAEGMLTVLEFCIAFLPDEVVIKKFGEIKKTDSFKWIMEQIISSVENLLCFFRISARWNSYITEFTELNCEKITNLFGKNYYELIKLYKGCMLLRKRRIKEATLYLKEATISCRINNIMGGYIISKVYLILMYIQNGQMDHVEKVYEDTKRYIKENQLSLGGSSWEDMKVYIALYNNDMELIDEWWEKNSRDPLDEIAIYAYSRYLLIAKTAILKQDYFKAFSILDILLEHTKRFRQTMEEIQVIMLYAVLCYYVENEESAMLYFEQAFLYSKRYGFIEFIAEYGVVAIKLLERYETMHPKEDSFYQTVLDAAANWANLYPNYLIQTNKKKIHFTASETKMLQKLASDKTNQEIADELCITLNTVKHHTKNIYAKLGVNNRRKAVAAAKEYGFLF